MAEEEQMGDRRDEEKDNRKNHGCI
jgi:hypothetical protein